MTTAQAITRFKTLYDQYGSPYIPDSKILELLNIGQLEVLNRLLPDSLGGSVNFELDYNIYQVVVPLIYDIDVAQGAGQTISGDSALILRDTIRTSLRTASADTTCQVFRILSVGVLESSAPLIFKKVKYIKRNQVNAHTANTFKKFTTSNYGYTDGSGVFRIYPNPNALVRFAVMKTPRILLADNTPDWDDYTMNQVIFQGLKLAGVSVSDEKIISDLRSTGIQSAQ